jgi:hypothetical protein
VLAAPSARADGTTTDQTLAQSLFDEALRLMDQGKFSEACPKLAESQRLDPGGGTLVNLGFCREKEGKLASAWAAYNEALSQAIRDGRKDRETAARANVDQLDGKVAKLAIDLSDAARHTDGIEIHLDGAAIRQAAWGVLTPIDRGDHTLVVTAPGKRDYTTKVSITTDGGVQRVKIPALENAPIVRRDRDLGTTIPERRSNQALLGWVTGAVGLAFVGAGVVTGVEALDQHSQSNANCPTSNSCNQAGVDAENRAKTFAWLSDFGVGIGAAAIVTGLVLVFTAPRARVVPVVSAHGAGAAFSMSF